MKKYLKTALAALFFFAFTAAMPAGIVKTADTSIEFSEVSSALGQLTQISGAEISPTPKIEAVPQISLSLVRRAIPPGRDLLPRFSDPGRVEVILKIIEDVYYERPLPFPEDGTIFYNREELLPQMPSGFYREYTVIAPPGSPACITIGEDTYCITRGRGTERIVIGGEELVYYTMDHYNTFVQIYVVR